QTAGKPSHCCSNEPAPASITTVMANRKNVTSTSNTSPRWRPSIACMTSLWEGAASRCPMEEKAIDSKANITPDTTQPSRPMVPKLAKNCRISCPDAKPAPTITPTNAPAILQISLNEPIAMSPDRHYKFLDGRQIKPAGTQALSRNTLPYQI